MVLIQPGALIENLLERELQAAADAVPSELSTHVGRAMEWVRYLCRGRMFAIEEPCFELAERCARLVTTCAEGQHVCDDDVHAASWSRLQRLPKSDQWPWAGGKGFHDGLLYNKYGMEVRRSFVQAMLRFHELFDPVYDAYFTGASVLTSIPGGEDFYYGLRLNSLLICRNSLSSALVSPAPVPLYQDFFHLLRGGYVPIGLEGLPDTDDDWMHWTKHLIIYRPEELGEAV